MLCFGFEDWANINKNEPHRRTLTFAMDEGFRWGRFLTVKMEQPMALQQVALKSNIALPTPTGSALGGGAVVRQADFKVATRGTVDPYMDASAQGPDTRV